jgi:hypothetical protein
LSQTRPLTSQAGVSHGLGSNPFPPAGTRVAVALTPDELSVEAVAAAASRLITEPGFAAAAAHIRAEISAMPTAADVLASDLLPARTDNNVPA